MDYVSTRGQAPRQPFSTPCSSGLARDGGLYTPDAVPRSSRRRHRRPCAGMPYAEAAARLMAPFVGGAWSDAELLDMTEAAYRGFRHAARAPLRPARRQSVPARAVPRPDAGVQGFRHAVPRPRDEPGAGRARRPRRRSSARPPATPARRRSRRSAAATRTDVFILYPHGRVSEVQRRQMTTVDRPGVHAIADRRLVRRLPGHREEPVRRSRRFATEMRCPASIRSTGRASSRRSSITSPPPSRSARPHRARLVRRADRQFRRRARRLVRQAHGAAGRAA